MSLGENPGLCAWSDVGMLFLTGGGDILWFWMPAFGSWISGVWLSVVVTNLKTSKESGLSALAAVMPKL